MNTLNRYNFYLQSITDVIALIIAYSIAFWWKFLSPFRTGIYQEGVYVALLPGFVVAYFLVAWFLLAQENFHGFSFTSELKSATKTAFADTVLVVGYLFLSKTTETYSREFIAVYAGLFWFFLILSRMILKTRILPIVHASKNAEQLVLVGGKYRVLRELERVKERGDWRFAVAGLIFTDVDETGEHIDEFRVIAGKANMEEVVRENTIDSIMVVPETLDMETREMAKLFHDMGKTVYLDVEAYHILSGGRQSLDKIGSISVLSFQPVARISRRDLFVKRFLDIVIALALLPLLVAIWILSFLFTNLESPGPVMISRIRVGKGGRRFNQYRFRIMRMDVEERIAAGKNPMTLWGRFLSVSHLDRLPLLLNVLISDMSLVGPHSPRFVRFLEYGSERRKNLSMRPGILGHWSFELEESKIIEEERNYIEHYSLLKDGAIILEFFFRYLTGRLVRGYDGDQVEEELGLIAQHLAFKQPFVYDESCYTRRMTFTRGIYLFVKRAVDIVGSFLAIVVLSPLFLVLIISVMMDDGGAPIYTHQRIGYRGKRVRVYKFRSMRKDAGDLEKLLTKEQLEQYRREFKIQDDPRITKVGNFLRRTSLDELPQLFNILSGTLSFVGPRPIVEEETKHYGDDIGKFLSVKPGLTGYWQAYARNRATYETGERQAMEMYYIEHCSLWLDFRILLKTFASVSKQEGVEIKEISEEEARKS